MCLPCTEREISRTTRASHGPASLPPTCSGRSDQVARRHAKARRRCSRGTGARQANRLGHAVDVAVHAVKEYLNLHAHRRILLIQTSGLSAAHGCKTSSLTGRHVCTFCTQSATLASLVPRPLSCRQYPSVEAIRGLNGKTLKMLDQDRPPTLMLWAFVGPIDHRLLRSKVRITSCPQQQPCALASAAAQSRLSRF